MSWGLARRPTSRSIWRRRGGRPLVAGNISARKRGVPLCGVVHVAQWLVLTLLAMLGGPTLLSDIQSEADLHCHLPIRIGLQTKSLRLRYVPACPRPGEILPTAHRIYSRAVARNAQPAIVGSFTYSRIHPVRRRSTLAASVFPGYRTILLPLPVSVRSR
jgi:hypothetical protein